MSDTDTLNMDRMIPLSILIHAAIVTPDDADIGETLCALAEDLAAGMTQVEVDLAKATALDMVVGE